MSHPQYLRKVSILVTLTNIRSVRDQWLNAQYRPAQEVSNIKVETKTKWGKNVHLVCDFKLVKKIGVFFNNKSVLVLKTTFLWTKFTGEFINNYICC